MKLAYNLVWINSGYSTADAEFKPPVSDETVKNIQHIIEKNPNVDVRFWIDYARLSPLQIGWLQDLKNKLPSNFSIPNLQEISEYRNKFFSEPDTSDWRFDKNSLIWRQVDAARILVCLQGDYDQSFYSDADVTNLVIESEEIQKKMKYGGIVLAGWVDKNFPWYENQMFGFSRDKHRLLRSLYNKTISEVSSRHKNGYDSYIDFINDVLKKQEGMDTREMLFECKHDGSFALDTKHEPNQEKPKVDEPLGEAAFREAGHDPFIEGLVNYKFK